MFRKILVANRGEIACRIMRTARRLGIATAAVYCDSDSDALHVEMADEAVNIGPPPAARSYLLIDRIVDAARRTGADAVHPGYGFLSERAAFAEALAAAGIAFIGPNVRAIAAMGDKIESKRLAAAAGVSTIPGHPGTLDTPGAAVAAAVAIGFPVIVKASAGGGGKGMRVARNEREAAEAWRLTRSEARSSFGDDRVFVEKYVENPRHVEIQVLGDRQGQIIHLGERECSIQRRNQKIVEEAPSPAVDAELRARMGAEAVALARAVHYDSAGTVEFIMDADRRFYFLEMNTRLQVEHPVTELVTGLDLVEQMIRVAAGQPLALRQEDVRLDGWAVEARLYAEDPYRGFLPAAGHIDRYAPPGEGRQGAATIRLDSGVRAGSDVPIYFDPLVAKLIAHAADRVSATEAIAAALDRFVIDGVASNRPFLSALFDHPRWREARLSTDLIGQEFPNGFAGVKPANETLTRLAMIALAIELARRARLKTLPGRLNGEGAGGGAEWVVWVGGERLTFAADAAATSSGGFAILASALQGPVIVTSDWRPGDRLWSGTVGDVALAVQVHAAVGGLRLAWRGVELSARVMSPRLADLETLMPAKRAGDSSKALRSPMPGLVIAVEVDRGDKVHAGQTLAVVEAMKMENVLRAERDAVVKQIAVEPGDTLAVDAVIMEFE